MPDQTQAIVNFDRRFARPYQLDRSAIEAAIEACPQVWIEAYVAGVLDGMTGRRRPCSAGTEDVPTGIATDTTFAGVCRPASEATGSDETQSAPPE